MVENFYCGRLGFEKTFSYRPFGDDSPCYFGLIRDGVMLHVSSFPNDGRVGNAVVLIVDNVYMLHMKFILKGVKIDLPPTDQSWGNLEMYIKNADDNSIRFTQWMDAE